MFKYKKCLVMRKKLVWLGIKCIYCRLWIHLWKFFGLVYIANNFVIPGHYYWISSTANCYISFEVATNFLFSFFRCFYWSVFHCSGRSTWKFLITKLPHLPSSHRLGIGVDQWKRSQQTCVWIWTGKFCWIKLRVDHI